MGKDGASKFGEFVFGASQFLVEHQLDYGMVLKVLALMIRGYSDIDGIKIIDDRYEELSILCKEVKQNHSKTVEFVIVMMGGKFAENMKFVNGLTAEVSRVFSV